MIFSYHFAGVPARVGCGGAYLPSEAAREYYRRNGLTAQDIKHRSIASDTEQKTNLQVDDDDDDVFYLCLQKQSRSRAPHIP
jgi:hypothetical protein